MPSDSSYGSSLTTRLPMSEAIERVTQALGEEGFGVLTRIDAHEVLKRKLGHERRPYVILGACNPSLAKTALEADPDVGLLLPCNVVVREGDDGATVIAFLDPVAMLQMAESPALAELAMDARERLERVRTGLQRDAAK